MIPWALAVVFWVVPHGSLAADEDPSYPGYPAPGALAAEVRAMACARSDTAAL